MPVRPPMQETIHDEVLGWVLGLAFVTVGIAINYPCTAWLVAVLLFLTLHG